MRFKADAMLSIVRDAIKKYHMFEVGESVLVGLSGGADSVVLLHVLLSLQRELGLPQIFAVHVNHNLRGKASDADADFVSQLCEDCKIELKIFQADVKKLAETRKIGIEEAGRHARHSIFTNAMQSANAKKIALGHHRDDVAETVLMNLCRGAGLKGLCGIPPVNGAIVRPLIHVPRQAIENYAKLQNLSYITDLSNFSQAYTRNRVRQSVMQVIEQMVNPNAKAIIARNAEMLRDDEDFLARLSMEAYDDCATQNAENQICLDAKKLTHLPESLGRRVVRMAISTALNKAYLPDISAKHVQAVLELARGHTGKVVHLPGIVVRNEYAKLIISDAEKIDHPHGFIYPIEVDTPLYISETGKIITLSQSPPQENSPPSLQNPILHCTKTFECDMVTGACLIRTRCPGDRIILEGFSKKLQDYFTDAKIPKNARDLIPLLVIDSAIACILDKKGRVSANFKSGKQKYWLTLWSDDEWLN